MEKQITVYGIVDSIGSLYDVYFNGECAKKFVEHTKNYQIIPLHGTYTLPKKLVTKTKKLWASDKGIDYIENEEEFSPRFSTKSDEHYKYEVTITYQVEE